MDSSCLSAPAADTSNIPETSAPGKADHTEEHTGANPAGQSTTALIGAIRDALAFVTRKKRLSRRCIDEAALAAYRVIHLHEKRSSHGKGES